MKVTNIAIVLDRSGSMHSIEQEAIDAFNQQVDVIKKLKTDDMEVYVTLVYFDTEASMQIENLKTDEVMKLTKETYMPRGFTAMLDGIDLAITSLQKNTKNVDDEAFLVSIISDGQENNSKKISAKVLQSKIKDLDAKDNWTFTFLGANVDLHNIAESTGIQINNMMAFVATPDGMKKANSYTYSAVGSYMGLRGAVGDKGTSAKKVKNFYGNQTEDKK